MLRREYPDLAGSDATRLIAEHTMEPSEFLVNLRRQRKLKTDFRYSPGNVLYNQLLPDDNELSATLFIEIDNEALLKATLPKLAGIEQSVRLKIGDRLTVPGVGEAGRSRDDFTSSALYLRFPFPAEAKEALARGDQPIWLEIDHPNYGAGARLSRETVEALAQTSGLRTEC